jgi:hypothetical protein
MMPRKRTDGFEYLPVPQQQEQIDRYDERQRIRKANNELHRFILAWVTDLPPGDKRLKDEFMQLFEDGGHWGTYHVDTSVTTYERLQKQKAMFPDITKRLKDTPLDYMGAIELSYVHQRITEMIARLQENPQGGTMAEAIALYRQVGATIRQKIFTETGHYPEQFPIPYGRITGNEAPGQFRLRDHQPPLPM